MQFVSFIGCGLYNVAKLAVLTVGGTAAVSILTKPDEASFDKYFNTYASKKFDEKLSSGKNNTSIISKVGTNIANKIASSSVNKISSKQFGD